MKKSSVSAQRSRDAPISLTSYQCAPPRMSDAVWQRERFSLRLRRAEGRRAARGIDDPRGAAALGDEVGPDHRRAGSRGDPSRRDAARRALLSREDVTIRGKQHQTASNSTCGGGRSTRPALCVKCECQVGAPKAPSSGLYAPGSSVVLARA